MDDLSKFDFWGGSVWDFFQGLGKFRNHPDLKKYFLVYYYNGIP